MNKKFRKAGKSNMKLARFILSAILTLNQPSVRALLENENTWHIQRVACLKEFRRQGLAKKLLQYIEHKAKENKLAYLTLGAQDQAQGFYLSLGYHVVGAGFLDAGINHHRMDKKI